MVVTTPRDTRIEPLIDELGKEVEAGFAEVNKKIDDLALVDSKLAESSARTDKRLVELKVEMNAGFKRSDERFEKLDGKLEKLDEKFGGKFEKLDEKFDRKFDRLTWHLLAGAIAIIVALIGVIGAVIAS